MSGKYPVVLWRELDAFLKMHNFYLKSQKGSYMKYEHISGAVIIVPRYRIISIGVLKGIIRQLSLIENLTANTLPSKSTIS